MGVALYGSTRQFNYCNTVLDSIRQIRAIKEGVGWRPHETVGMMEIDGETDGGEWGQLRVIDQAELSFLKVSDNN